MGALQELQSLFVAGAIGKAEEDGAPRIDRFEQLVGAEYFGLQASPLFLGELGVGQAVVGQCVLRSSLRLTSAGVPASVCRRCRRRPDAAHLEEDGRGSILFQDGRNLAGVGPVGAIVEGQYQGLGRQSGAEDFASFSSFGFFALPRGPGSAGSVASA